MLDDTLKSQLAAYLERVTQPFELVATLGDDDTSRQMRELLQTIQSLRADKITLRTDGLDARKPSFTLQRVGASNSLRFAGLPLGHEFTSLVLALLWTGGHPPKVEPEVIEQIQALDGDFNFEVYMSLSCHNCPDVVQALSLMAIFNPKVRTTVIEGGAFQDEVNAREIMAVPMVFLNGTVFGSGRMDVEEIVAKLDTGAAARDAAKLSAKAPYDVLIVGGGPAGAAAAVYAARKGIRTGVAAERFGGQVNDTLAIENYISVLETDGPKFAAALEAHARAYEVDIMNLQLAEKLIPAAEPGGLIEVKLANGGSLKGKTVILSTGARWRNVNVPGEAEYRNKGVAYCPHCDGPLFKGKDVAVIGGGNSGIEAAIDLAGVVNHVTVIEFMPELKADAVLVKKLHSLPNVTVHTNAQTTEITGAEGKVNGLRYKDRATGEEHLVPLAGVFVQIGLVPNTEWLKGTLELTKFGEIVIDAKGQTSVAGVFAAGDCTTVPFKQIVIAAGAGATAALSAFDHLIRTPALEAVAGLRAARVRPRAAVPAGGWPRGPSRPVPTLMSPDELPAFLDHHLAVADGARHLAGAINHQPVAHGQVAVKAAADFRDVDLGRALERADLGDLHQARIHGRLDQAFDDQRVAVGDLDPLELDVGADDELAAARHCNGRLCHWREGHALDRGCNGWAVACPGGRRGIARQAGVRAGTRGQDGGFTLAEKGGGGHGES
jgi:alkyl hydroperoxide reductase subunit F